MHTGALCSHHPWRTGPSGAHVACTCTWDSQQNLTSVLHVILYFIRIKSFARLCVTRSFLITHLCKLLPCLTLPENNVE